MIDTHAHLDACADPPEVLLSRARAAGVDRIIAIGSGIESCRAALDVAEREHGVFAALGIHPHEAAGVGGPRWDEELRELLAHPQAVAVGETGLDLYRNYAPPGAQLELFRAQAALAVELGKALVVHSRAADSETAAVLAELPPATPVVLHCFSSPGLLEPALDGGHYVSFAGNVTYPRAAELRAAAARVPGDRILAETDSPYLAPQPVRGRPNEPANLVHTLVALAQVRGEETGELAERIGENAAAAFGLP